MTLTNGMRLDPVKLFEEFVGNSSSLGRLGYLSSLLDPRRDIEAECGYPSIGASIDPYLYQDLYDREPIPRRVVEVWPKEAWQVQPNLYETEDPDDNTEFEKAWDALGKQLRGEHSYYADEAGSSVWEILKRADIQSGIGHYGVILLGLDDGKDLREPASPVEWQAPKKVKNGNGKKPLYQKPKPQPIYDRNPRPWEWGTFPTSQDDKGAFLLSQGEDAEWGGQRLLYARVFPESLCQITRFDADPTSPRYMQPLEYLLTFNSPRDTWGSSAIGMTTASRNVHWSRVVHIADNAGPNTCLGVPRLKPVLHNVLSLRKVYGADAEGFWRNGILKLFFETHPQLGGEVEIDKEAFKDTIENMMNGLQQWMVTKGMSAKSIPPALSDPSPHVAVQIEAICIQLACPVRIFKGSERGELASSQDDDAWNDRLKERNNSYTSPCVIQPFTDRLISLGVLPTPKKGYKIHWPDLTSESDKDKAAIASQRTSALVQFISGSGEQMIQPHTFLTRYQGFTDEEADQEIEAAQALAQQKAEEQQMQAAGQQDGGGFDGGQDQGGGDWGDGNGYSPDQSPSDLAPQFDAAFQEYPPDYRQEQPALNQEATVSDLFGSDDDITVLDNANPEGCNQYTGPDCAGGSSTSSISQMRGRSSTSLADTIVSLRADQERLKVLTGEARTQALADMASRLNRHTVTQLRELVADLQLKLPKLKSALVGGIIGYAEAQAAANLIPEKAPPTYSPTNPESFIKKALKYTGQTVNLSAAAIHVAAEAANVVSHPLAALASVANYQGLKDYHTWLADRYGSPAAHLIMAQGALLTAAMPGLGAAAYLGGHKLVTGLFDLASKVSSKVAPLKLVTPEMVKAASKGFSMIPLRPAEVGSVILKDKGPIVGTDLNLPPALVHAAGWATALQGEWIAGTMNSQVGRAIASSPALLAAQLIQWSYQGSKWVGTKAYEQMSAGLASLRKDQALGRAWKWPKLESSTAPAMLAGNAAVLALDEDTLMVEAVKFTEMLFSDFRANLSKQPILLAALGEEAERVGLAAQVVVALEEDSLSATVNVFDLADDGWETPSELLGNRNPYRHPEGAPKSQGGRFASKSDIASAAAIERPAVTETKQLLKSLVGKWVGPEKALEVQDRLGQHTLKELRQLRDDLDLTGVPRSAAKSVLTETITEHAPLVGLYPEARAKYLKDFLIDNLVIDHASAPIPKKELKHLTKELQRLEGQPLRTLAEGIGAPAGGNNEEIRQAVLGRVQHLAQSTSKEAADAKATQRANRIKDQFGFDVKLPKALPKKPKDWEAGGKGQGGKAERIDQAVNWADRLTGWAGTVLEKTAGGVEALSTAALYAAHPTVAVGRFVQRFDGGAHLVDEKLVEQRAALDKNYGKFGGHLIMASANALAAAIPGITYTAMTSGISVYSKLASGLYNLSGYLFGEAGWRNTWLPLAIPKRGEFSDKYLRIVGGVDSWPQLGTQFGSAVGWGAAVGGEILAHGIDTPLGRAVLMIPGKAVARSLQFSHWLGVKAVHGLGHAVAYAHEVTGKLLKASGHQLPQYRTDNALAGDPDRLMFGADEQLALAKEAGEDDTIYIPTRKEIEREASKMVEELYRVWFDYMLAGRGA